MRVVIANSGFRRLWIAQVILVLGDSCMRLGLLEYFQRAGLDVKIETAKILFAVALPATVFGPLAMVLLDRWQRRRVLMVADVLRATMVMTMVLWIIWGSASGRDGFGMWPVYVSLFWVGAITTFSYPARYALIPNLVETENLVKANTLFTTSLAIANGAGLPLGGLVAEKLGPGWALSCNAVAYMISIALVAGIRMQPHATQSKSEAGMRGELDKLRTGLGYMWRHPVIMPLAFMAAVFAFLLGVFIVAVVGYAKEVLNLGTAGMGYLATSVVVGAGIGIGLIGRGKPWTRSVWLPVGQLVTVGVLLVLLGHTTQVPAATALLTGVGTIAATVMIPIDAKLQAEVDDTRRGAVFAARGIMTSGAMLTAFWLQWGTAFFRVMPASRIMVLLGTGAIVASALTWAVLRGKGRATGLEAGARQ